MNGQVTRVVTATSRTTALAFATIATWLAATALTGSIGIWLALGGAAVALGVAVLAFDRPAPGALLQPSPRLVVLGAVAGVLMAAATYWLYPVLARLLPFIATDTARLYSAFRAPSRAVASLALLPVIVGEELVWRGVVQASLVQRLGAWGGVALAAVVYALMHGASRLARAGGGRVLLRARLVHFARHDSESRSHLGGSPAVGRARPALAATGHQMKKGAPNASRRA